MADSYHKMLSITKLAKRHVNELDSVMEETVNFLKENDFGREDLQALPGGRSSKDENENFLSQVEKCLIESGALANQQQALVKALDEVRIEIQRQDGQNGADSLNALIDQLQRSFVGLNARTPESERHLNDLQSLMVEPQDEEPEASASEEQIDEDVAVMSTQTQERCPLTRLPMRNRLVNRLCGHAYEREAIMRHITGRDVPCPQAGCQNREFVKPEHLSQKKV